MATDRADVNCTASGQTTLTAPVSLLSFVNALMLVGTNPRNVVKPNAMLKARCFYLKSDADHT